MNDPRVTQLSDQQLSEFHADGFVVLQGVFSRREIAAWDTECLRLLQLDVVHPGNPRTPHRRVGVWKRIVERLDPVVDISRLLELAAHDERILGPSRQILREEPVLFKDKLIFKLPGMSGYAMHQDWAWWPVAPENSMLSVQIAIDGAAAENGALELFGGYHDRLLSPQGEARNMTPEEARAVDPRRGRVILTEPGDVVIFHPLTPHRSGGNLTKHSRRSLYLTYAAASCGDHYREYYERQHREVAERYARERQLSRRLSPARIVRLLRRLARRPE
jgi:ectoine hydroxylase-related dioxygenase (phytanoyl-CoA dioxygenase family)